MRINLFGGPGVGKSALASGIYFELKKLGYSIELVHEFVKKWAFLKRKPRGFDQIYIFGKQIHSEDLILQSGIRHVITDSPIMMQCVYAEKYNFPCIGELLNIAKKYDKIHPSLNILLDRKGIPYQSLGRYENEDQAGEMDLAIEKFLDNHVEYHKFKTIDSDKIIDLIKSSLNV